MSATNETPPLVQSLRVMIGALLAAPVMITLAVAFVLPVGEPDPIFLGILLVVSAAVAAAIPAFGYRLVPIERGVTTEEAQRQALSRFQSAAMLRFALAEAPVIVGVAVAFVDQSLVHCLVGAVASLILMGLHVWPTRRVVERCAERLEADGVASGLRSAFGY